MAYLLLGCSSLGKVELWDDNQEEKVLNIPVNISITYGYEYETGYHCLPRCTHPL